jgi:PAS domain S-box-containing protein
VGLRQVGLVTLVLAITAAGFLGARALDQRDARRDSERRAEVAAAEVNARMVQGAALLESLRRFMAAAPLGRAGSGQFENVAARWLSPAGVPAAAWIERVPASRRAAYERRIGHPIATVDRQGRTTPVEPRPSYLPATLVSHFPPMAVPGIDLGVEPGVAAAVARPRTLYDVSATPLSLQKGTRGLFLLKSAQRLVGGIVEPGFLALFIQESWLRAAASDTPKLQLTTGTTPPGNPNGAATVSSTFTAAGQRFTVLVPRGSVGGPAEVLPWIILGSGLVLAALAGALGVISGRRAKAMAEVDRLFTISPDLIVVSGFDGYFKRVNPAFERRLGYREHEALSRPLIEFIHPDDRERTTAKRREIMEGDAPISFQNRYVCKSGSFRWIEWTAVPVFAEQQIYAVGRDVTERREAEGGLREAEERNRALAEEQAALRRVATLVARRASPEKVFAAVAEEVGQLLPVSSAAMGRYDPDGMITTVAAWSAGDTAFPVGGRWIPEGRNVMTLVFETGRPARLDSFDDASGPVGLAAREAGYKSAVGTPIIVDGRRWGVMSAASSVGEPLPPDTEARLASFTELVATAIANTESRAALGKLAQQQAALRRVATLVAQAVSPSEVFEVVTREIGLLSGADLARMERYETDGTVTAVAGWSRDADQLGVGMRFALEGVSIAALVRQTGRPVRVDSFARAPGPIAQDARELGIRSSVGGPIVVAGRLWGVIAASSKSEEPFPADTESQISDFTELVATAIANAEAQAEVTASRARIVAASDGTRRRIERDLHDGTQQRLVTLGMHLRMAESTVPAELDETRRTIDRIAVEVDRVIDELREMSRGIHPAVLSEGGLGPALRTLARRSAIPVALGNVVDARLPEPIEVAGYYVVSEALTNASKHANASRVEIEAAARDAKLRLSIRDDGVGGAKPREGSGLVGLRDRVEAVGGSIEISSPPGEGTHVVVELPLEFDLIVDVAEDSRSDRVPAGR